MDESPLIEISRAGARTEALPWAPRFVLRGKEAAREAISRALDIELPVAACRQCASGGWQALWLGPDEWLLIGSEASPSDAERVADRLRQLTEPHAAVEISDRQVAFAVIGERAADVLNTGCPLDLDLTVFPIGMCTRTIFAKAEIVLLREARDRFRVEVWRSFHDYVAQLIDIAIGELDCGLAA